MSRAQILRRLSGIAKLALGERAAHHQIDIGMKIRTSEGDLREVVHSFDLTIVNVDTKSALAATELHAREIGMTFNGESEKRDQAMTEGRIVNLTDDEMELYAIAEIRRIRKKREKEKARVRPQP